MDSFCCICTKNIYNCRKDEEVVTLLRSYAQQISIHAMKKIGAPLLGLAKYIYILFLKTCHAKLEYTSECFEAKAGNH